MPNDIIKGYRDILTTIRAMGFTMCRDMFYDWRERIPLKLTKAKGYRGVAVKETDLKEWLGLVDKMSKTEIRYHSAQLKVCRYADTCQLKKTPKECHLCVSAVGVEGMIGDE